MRQRIFTTSMTLAWTLAATLTAQAQVQALRPVPAASIASAKVSFAVPTVAPMPYAWRGREAEIEDFLRSAPVVRWKDIPVGITKPRRAYFAPGGPATSMAWKPLSPGMLHGKMESYRSEIAAYLLSRHLGLDLVPPVVERQEQGVKGAAVYWIEGVAPWNPAHPPKAAGAKWSRLTSRMLMFDQLIANIDRNQGNLLHDEAGYMYLIDHSRAFTRMTHLSGLKAPAQYDRALWMRMAALTQAELEAVLSPWLTDVQIAAMLERRDEMRKQIDRHVRERGDLITFLPAEPVASLAAAR